MPVDTLRVMQQWSDRFVTRPRGVQITPRPAAGVPAEWIAPGGPLLQGMIPLAPEHPFPAALNDGLAVYRSLTMSGTSPRNAVLLGASAGGNLALAALMSLRDAGDLLPAAAVCLSPMIDRGLLVWRKERLLRHEDLPVISPPFRNVLQIRVNVPLGVCGPSGRRSREARHDHRDIHDHQRGRKWTHPPNGGGRLRVSRRRPQFLMCLDDGVSPIRNAPGRIDEFSVWPICHPVRGSILGVPRSRKRFRQLLGRASVSGIVDGTRPCAC